MTKTRAVGVGSFSDRIEQVKLLRERAEADYHRRIDLLERQRKRIEREGVEAAKAMEAEKAKQTLASYQDRLEATIDRLGANVWSPPVACRLHLIDLVRGGYQPGCFELHVPAIGVFRPFYSGAHPRSLCGSAAAMAAEG